MKEVAASFRSSNAAGLIPRTAESGWPPHSASALQVSWLGQILFPQIPFMRQNCRWAGLESIHMFDIDLTELDADETVAHAVACRAAADRAEVQILAAAAHYADLHGVVGRTSPETGRVLPGSERLVEFGGDGTPKVAEFAPAELGAALGLSPTSAGLLIGDALDLRHRLPILWGRLQAGEVKAWVGRKIARATRSYDADGGGRGRRPGRPVCRPAVLGPAGHPAVRRHRRRRPGPGQGRRRGRRHPARRVAATRHRPRRRSPPFCATPPRTRSGSTPPSTGSPTPSPSLGDTRPKQQRRAAAVGILANPQATLDLLQQAAAAAAAADATRRSRRRALPTRPSAAPTPPATVAQTARLPRPTRWTRIRAEGGVTDADLPDPDPADPRTPATRPTRRHPAQPPAALVAGRWMPGRR